MLLLAAATTTLDRLRDIPGEFWLRLAFAIVVFVGMIIFLRKVAKMNKVVLTVVGGFVAAMIGFNWIYERNEPAWATPVVGWMSGFFPSKGVPAKAPSGTPSTAQMAKTKN